MPRELRWLASTTRFLGLLTILTILFTFTACGGRSIEGCIRDTTSGALFCVPLQEVDPTDGGAPETPRAIIPNATVQP